MFYVLFIFSEHNASRIQAYDSAGSATGVLQHAAEAVQGGLSVRAAAVNLNIDRMTLSRYCKEERKSTWSSRVCKLQIEQSYLHLRDGSRFRHAHQGLGDSVPWIVVRQMP